jgi:hypothetical protein
MNMATTIHKAMLKHVLARMMPAAPRLHLRS